MENQERIVFSNARIDFDKEYSSLSNLVQQKFHQIESKLGEDKGLLYDLEELASSLWILELKFLK